MLPIRTSRASENLCHVGLEIRIGTKSIGVRDGLVHRHGPVPSHMDETQHFVDTICDRHTLDLSTNTGDAIPAGGESIWPAALLD